MLKNSNIKIGDTRKHNEIVSQITRESTPEELILLNQYFERYKARVKEGLHAENISGHVRQVLDLLNLSEIYKPSLDINYPVYQNDNKASIEETLNWLGKKFLHALLTSNDGCWVVVTQVEIYFKDTTIDK